MRSWSVVTIALALIVILLAIKEVRLSRQIESLRQDKEQSSIQQQALNERMERAEAKVESAPDQFTSQSIPTSSAGEKAQLQKRIVSLETQFRNFKETWKPHPSGPTVPEYDPTNPPLQPATQDEANTAPKRSWGTEQILGPPDTERAGDAPTAWASLQENAGPEWLALGFERAVEVAQVRIRESYNPGAISKVTVLVNGSEVVLWEGTASGGKAPRDFVVPVNGSIQAQSIVVHLDTTRVPGWNEIDAVELVGRDGSRQWATSASASSTYAEPRAATNTTPLSFQR